jgi:uncharacterized OB-fold protein
MEIPRHWRLKAQRYRLEGSVCPICSRPAFPPRPVCPDCSAQLVRKESYEISVFPPSSQIEETVSAERMTG